LGLILAFGDVPPLDSFLAHVSLVYLGRIRHLRALRQYGVRRLRQVIEPHGTDSSLSVTGMYDAERRVKAASIAQFQLKADSGTPYFLQLKMSSPRDIIGFRISFTKPEKELAQRTPIPASFAPRIAHVIDEGRSFLRARDFVVAAPYGARFTHYSGAFQFSPKEANLAPYLTWMRNLIALLEEVTRAEMATPFAE
jgi:hypothetical protein